MTPTFETPITRVATMRFIPIEGYRSGRIESVDWELAISDGVFVESVPFSEMEPIPGACTEHGHRIDAAREPERHPVIRVLASS